MAAIWFTLSAVFVLVALIVLQVDKKRRAQRRKLRAVWGARRGLGFARNEPKLARQWHYGAIGAHTLQDGRNVVSGVPRKSPGDTPREMFLFDLDDATTVLAVQLPVASSVVFELVRADVRRDTRKKAGHDQVRLVAEIGDRLVLSTDAEVARRSADLRLVSFTDSLPAFIEMLWIEADWALVSLPLNTGWHEWDLAEHAVHRFATMMEALPSPRATVSA